MLYKKFRIGIFPIEVEIPSIIIVGFILIIVLAALIGFVYVETRDNTGGPYIPVTPTKNGKDRHYHPHTPSASGSMVIKAIIVPSFKKNAIHDLDFELV